MGRGAGLPGVIERIGIQFRLSCDQPDFAAEGTLAEKGSLGPFNTLSVLRARKLRFCRMRFCISAVLGAFFIELEDFPGCTWTVFSASTTLADRN